MKDIAEHSKVKVRLLEDNIAAGFIKSLKEIDDVEAKHMVADDILCSILETFGYEETVKEFKSLEKWYS